MASILILIRLINTYSIGTACKYGAIPLWAHTSRLSFEEQINKTKIYICQVIFFVQFISYVCVATRLSRSDSNLHIYTLHREKKEKWYSFIYLYVELLH